MYVNVGKYISPMDAMGIAGVCDSVGFVTLIFFEEKSTRGMGNSSTTHLQLC